MSRIAGGWLPNNAEDLPIRRFELKEALTPGGSAVAYIMVHDEASGTYKRATRKGVDVEFAIKAFLRSFEGDGESETHYGERGLAIFHRDSKVWEIWQLDCDRILKAA